MLKSAGISRISRIIARHTQLTFSVLPAGQVVDPDLVVGAEDDEEVVEQVEEEHLRLHLR